ncbi:zinc finger protein 606-like [Aphidius gifuensis]|uniref:zinc finger protein 606-like n=1 Tax=Aphidius gifuensis TaxID=684658 RepID=UPI001CDBE277|nr:zinc finger protein 606-like [Aphidius gifuensis]
MYRVVVVCNSDGDKSASLIMGDQEVARNITMLRPQVDPLGDNQLVKTEEFTSHKNIAHKTSYNCSSCNDIFMTKKSLSIHLKTHVKNDLYSCNKCTKKYKRQEGLNLHMIRKHNNNKPKFICDNCNKGYQFKSDLSAHMIRAHIPQKCDVCETFVNDIKSHIKKHEKDAKDMTELSCEYCQQKFTSIKKFELHKKKHIDSKNLKCKECNLIFPGRRALINHRDREHRSG